MTFQFLYKFFQLLVYGREAVARVYISFSTIHQIWLNESVQIRGLIRYRKLKLGCQEHLSIKCECWCASPNSLESHRSEDDSMNPKVCIYMYTTGMKREARTLSDQDNSLMD